MERVKTGIKGFDELVEGGFPKGSVVLVTGVPGSGKTVFCMQVARNLAKKEKKVLYLTADGESAEDLIAQAKLLGMDLSDVVKSGNLRVERMGKRGLGPFREIIKDAAKRGICCIILDSLSGAIPALYTPKDIQRYVFFGEVSIMGILDPSFAMRGIVSDMFNFLKEQNLDLVLIVTDRVPEGPGLSRDQVSEFIADGIINFDTLGIGGAFNRTLRVLKIRKSDHYKDAVTFEIKKGGIVITKEEIEKIAKEF
jgi:KaiC/GvpD/RAD55 family RecA-like ATPase